jgi:prefoldin alpha subunit
LTQSYSQLRGAQARFNDCKDSVDTLKTEKSEDKTILVPLTSSLYVPGKLSNVETVIVDVGTGYFVEKVS